MSKREFSKVSPAIWRSKRFNSLPSDRERLLLLYFMTSQHQNSAGAYHLPEGYAIADLGWSVEDYRASRTALEDAGLIAYDDDTEEVYVTGWFRICPPMNDKHASGTMSRISDIESDTLREALESEFTAVIRPGWSIGSAVEARVILTSTPTVSIPSIVLGYSMKTLCIYKTQTQTEKQTEEADPRRRQQTRERDADRDHPLHKPLCSTIPARAKAGLVPIESGQWVLAYVEHFYPGYIDGDMPLALEALVDGGSGWTCLREAGEQFDVLRVDRVMPATFTAAHQCHSPDEVRETDGKRRSRDLVVAAANTAGEMLALRDKLFTIGFAADRAIEEETARRMADFTAQARADALAKVRAALPHIFGRDA